MSLQQFLLFNIPLISSHAVISFLLVLCLTEINAEDKKHRGYFDLKIYDFENFQCEIYEIEILMSTPESKS